MTITAYVQGSPEHAGRPTADSTITIEGTTYPIPERGWYGAPDDRRPSRTAPHRISAALESAGYERGYTDLSGPTADGVFEIRVVRA